MSTQPSRGPREYLAGFFTGVFAGAVLQLMVQLLL